MKRAPRSSLLAIAIVGSVAILSHPGCGSPGEVGQGQGEGGTGQGGGGAGGVTINLTALGGASGSPGSGGVAGDAGPPLLAEGVCGNTSITPNKAPVDVLLVLDRSESMGWSMADDCYCESWPAADRQGKLCNPQPSNCVDRWKVVSAAVTQTISATPSLNWGLELFSGPDSPSCSVDFNPQVPIAANAGAQIQSLLTGMDLQLWTPTTLAVNVAINYLQNLNDGNSKNILLATDGEPNCKGGTPSSADDDIEATSQAAYAAAVSGFPVYVVGIGPSKAIANLDRLAQAGGTGHYYPADTPQALAEALASIAKIIETTCEYQPPTAAPDPAKVYVYVDKTLIQKSEVDGWTFGPTSTADIVLTGSTCASMKAGLTSTIQIIFGCEDYVPPLNIP